MDWKGSSRKDSGGIVVPGRWLYIHYYEALNILFRAENALRVFVYIILKCALQERWAEAAIQVEEGKQTTISALAARRIAQARGYGYLGFEIASPLMHLNSGELTRLMMSDAYWPHFESHFRGKREIIRAKLEEISTVRNALAHFRPIKHEDIDLVKQNIRHVFMGIEEMLNQVLYIGQVVPTNTTTDWYVTLNAKQTHLCTLVLKQSANEQWLSTQLVYRSPVLEAREDWAAHRSFRVLRLNSSAITRLYPEIAKLCAFVTEQVVGTASEDVTSHEFKKYVEIVFQRKALEAEYKTVGSAIEILQQKIEEESGLVIQDNLAKGTLIEAVRSRAVKNKDQQWWTVLTPELESRFHPDDPPEYWGSIVDPYSTDFIAGTARYPWMPVDVSDGANVFD